MKRIIILQGREENLGPIISKLIGPENVKLTVLTPEQYSTVIDTLNEAAVEAWDYWKHEDEDLETLKREAELLDQLVNIFFEER